MLNKQNLGRLLSVVVVAGTCLAAWIWFAPGKPAPAIDQPAPEIVGKDLDGKPMRLSDFRGKVVMLDFWGDW